MPPLAVVGYGIATRNLPVGAGAFALFVTNFITIALSATAMARFYGFGHHLSRRQSWMQTMLLLLVLVALAVPLGISLNAIGREAVATAKARTLLTAKFGDDARVTQLDLDFTASLLLVRAVVSPLALRQRRRRRSRTPLPRRWTDRCGSISIRFCSTQERARWRFSGRSCGRPRRLRTQKRSG